MSSTDPRDKARDRLVDLLLDAGLDTRPLEARRHATEFVRSLLADGWRPPPQPVRDWRDTRRLPPERVAEHANTARAALTHPDEEATT